MDWLDANTIAFNLNTNNDEDHKTMLWDMRIPDVTGTASRFRTEERGTGVLNASKSQDANQLLVSTNNLITLFDTRMPHSPSRPDQALLELPHTHQGPRQRYATNGQGLIAAMDREEVIQVYSTRSGDWVGSMDVPHSIWGDFKHVWVTELMWYDDERSGMCLQAAAQKGVAWWSWCKARCF